MNTCKVRGRDYLRPIHDRQHSKLAANLLIDDDHQVQKMTSAFSIQSTDLNLRLLSSQLKVK